MGTPSPYFFTGECRSPTSGRIMRGIQPAGCIDYRPISVTPILSRTIMERIIVSRWLHSSIPPELLNQYAYRPTGSNTLSRVHPCLFGSINRMLEISLCRAILIDFTKAFDIHVVNHTVLMSKLAELQLPGNIRIYDRTVSNCVSF